MRTRTVAVLRRIAIRFPALRRLIGTPAGRWLRARLVPTSPFDAIQSSGEEPPLSYEDYRLQRIAACARSYQDVREPGLLSFVTTVWNTDVAYLEALVDSLLEQSGGAEFEWFVLDNGSSHPDTVRFLEDLRRHPFVRLERVEKNLGILGGMRYCLERAANRYILPLDSDDYLYPKCVSIYTAAIQQAGYPALLFSDEDKLQDGLYRDAYYKPDWDPVLLVNSCYIAHLCAIDREAALSLGVYTDPAAEGSHDWDTFVRFMNAGFTPVHVPEVIYSWRMHPQSTAGNFRSKPIIYDSHTSVLRRFVAASPHATRFELISSPLFGGTPDWWISRRKIEPLPMATIRLVGSARSGGAPSGLANALSVDMREGLSGLLGALEQLPASETLVHLLGEHVEAQGDDWPWEARGQFELFPDCVMVGGRVFAADQTILSAGQYFGFGDGCSTPDRGRSSTDPGYFAQMWKPHSVSAVSSEHMVARVTFLRDAIRLLLDRREPASFGHLGAWCGALARRAGARVIYTPFMEGVATDDWASHVSEDEHRAFARFAWDLMPDTTLLSPHLGLDRQSAYRAVSQARRDRHLARLAQRFDIASPLAKTG